MWVERKLERPFLTVSKRVKITQGKLQEETLIWQNADEDVFGHTAYIGFVDPQGRLLAQQDTLFDVASNWSPVMRLVTVHNIWDDRVTEERIRGFVEDMRSGWFNTVEVFGWFAKSYELAPKKARWSSLYYPSPKHEPVSRKCLQMWGRELHRSGIRYVVYNESSVIEGPEDWQILVRWNNFETFCTLLRRSGDVHTECP